MSKQVQMFRLPAAQAGTYTGLPGQLVVDTSSWTIRVQDGVTAGGYPLLVASNNFSDVSNIVTARNNLDLGSAALNETSDFTSAAEGATLSTAVTAAQTTATTANTTANSAQTTATAAQTTANTANTAANAAQTTANTGVTNAAAAQTTANTANSNATTALADIAATNTILTAVGALANGAAQKANNLSDLSSASTSRTNLGLGNSATRNIGTTSGTVAAGDDSRIAGTLKASNNLSDVANTATAKSNLGIVDAPAWNYWGSTPTTNSPANGGNSNSTMTRNSAGSFILTNGLLLTNPGPIFCWGFDVSARILSGGSVAGNSSNTVSIEFRDYNGNLRDPVRLSVMIPI